jgi:hypothetical protein
MKRMFSDIVAWGLAGGGVVGCRVGWVGARSRKRGGLSYGLFRKHLRTEMLCLLISMFLRLGYMSMCPNGKCSLCIQIFWLSLGGYISLLF